MESLAGAYLNQHGIEILERNVRTPYGEIDLIGLDQQCLVFFEVRYRKSNVYGSPLETINYKKIRKLRKSMLWYLGRSDSMVENRLDIIAITNHKEQQIEWIKNCIIEV